MPTLLSFRVKEYWHGCQQSIADHIAWNHWSKEGTWWNCSEAYLSKNLEQALEPNVRLDQSPP